MNSAIDYARSLVGIRESQFKNRSPLIDQINKYVGIPLGSPYCAAGVSYCFHKAELVLPGPGPRIIKSGGSQAFKRFLRENDLLFTDPQRLMDCKGAIAGWTNPDDPGHGHLFFIEKRLTSFFKKVTAVGTIEFNTNGGGSRDGDGCWRLRRKVPVDRGHTLWFGDVSSFIGGQWWD